MKKQLKQLTAWIARHDLSWHLLDYVFFRAARVAEGQRRSVEQTRKTRAIVQDLFPDLIVRHGPFQGLKYPTAEALCSALLPKLLGSYEKEIQAVVEGICRAGYKLVIDIGCAEGYYAVGLATRMPTATIHAFDTDRGAQTLCRRMALMNGTDARVSVGGRCGPEDLCRLASQPGVVICDCEGFEDELFVSEVVSALRNFVIIIEVHDYSVKNLAADLASRFAPTHRVESVPCIDDEVKARSYQFIEVEKVDTVTRRFIVAERRPGGMEWLIMTPRAQSSPAEL